MAKVINNRAVDQAEWEAEVKKAPKAKVGEYRATDRGYAGGRVIEAGDLIPEDTPVSDFWMEKIKGKERGVDKAVKEATDPHPKDVDLTKLNVAALQSMAAERGINVEQDGTPLSKKDLITAIKAAIEVQAQ